MGRRAVIWGAAEQGDRSQVSNPKTEKLCQPLRPSRDQVGMTVYLSTWFHTLSYLSFTLSFSRSLKLYSLSQFSCSITNKVATITTIKQKIYSKLHCTLACPITASINPVPSVLLREAGMAMPITIGYRPGFVNRGVVVLCHWGKFKHRLQQWMRQSSWKEVNYRPLARKRYQVIPIQIVEEREQIKSNLEVGLFLMLG